MSGTAAIFFVWVSQVAALLTVLRLFKTGLYKRYRFFFWYLVFRAPSSALVALLNLKSKAYFFAWITLEPITLAFYCLVVLEVCRLMLERHKGLYTLGKWALYAGMLVSATVSMMTYRVHFQESVMQHGGGSHASLSKLMYFSMADRGVTCCLAVFLLLLLIVLSRYPVALPRNVILHIAVYTVFFWSNTLNQILLSVFGLRLYSTFDGAMAGVAALCTLAWLLFLTPKGEEVRVNVVHIDPRHESQLLLQFDALNSTMLKVARK